MKPAPHPPNPKALTLPLRDMLSGLRQIGLVPEPVAKTAIETLPTPLRAALRDIAGITTEELGLDHPDNSALISNASRALRTGTGSSTDVAKASALAIRHLLTSAPERSALVSETVLALCWSQAEEISTAAALFTTEIVKHAPFGETPGLPSEQSSASASQRKHIAATLCIWLLAERASSGIKESDLLGIASTIAEDLKSATPQIWTTPSTLQTALTKSAARI